MKALLKDVDKTLRGKYVLIVDDYEEIAQMLKDEFESHGAAVTPAVTGKDAMFMLAFGRFDLVILDLVMPSIDGWNIIRFLRHFRAAMMGHLIILTGDRYRHSTREWLRQTNLPIVYKPFKLEEILDAACRLVI